MPRPRKLHDEYFLKAKAEGFVARSAYKLLEINERWRVVRRGTAVVDLGCAPGSWLQVAERLVGPGGVVVGIDLLETTAPVGPAVRVLRGDAFKTPAAELLRVGGVERFETLLSDMAPNTSGHGDDLLSARLCRRVLELAPELLAPGGAMVMKIFEGAEYTAVLRETSGLFAESRGFKPKASREVSREMFIIGRGFVGARQASGEPTRREPGGGGRGGGGS